MTRAPVESGRARAFWKRVAAVSEPVERQPCCLTSLRESPWAKRCAWCGSILPDGKDVSAAGAEEERWRAL